MYMLINEEYDTIMIEDVGGVGYRRAAAIYASGRNHDILIGENLVMIELLSWPIFPEEL